MKGGFSRIVFFTLALIIGAYGDGATVLTNKTNNVLNVIRSQLPSNPNHAWCHDYTLYEASSHRLIEQNTTPDKLRAGLTKLGFIKRSHHARADWTPVQSTLFEHDVIIIGGAHSGVVCDDKGTISHYKKDGTYHKDSLNEIMNYCRSTFPGGSACPYRDKSIEVWRDKQRPIHNNISELSGILGSWEFGRNDTDFIGTVILTDRPGKYGGYYIDGYSHDNESYWKSNGNNSIVFLHKNGKPTTYFKRLNPDHWEGHFLPPEDWPEMENAIVHYLKR